MKQKKQTKLTLVTDKSEIKTNYFGYYLGFNEGSGKLYPLYAENRGDFKILHEFLEKGYLYKQKENE